MPEIFPNLKKETDIQVQEAKRVPNKMNLELHQDIIKMAKVEAEISKATREKQLITQKRNPIRLSADFQEKLYRLEGSGRIYLKF